MKRWLLAMLLLGVFGLLGCGGEKKEMVVMETSMGTIKIELFPEKAPKTVKNFLDYVDEKHYDGTIFHRVIKDFMIQGGGFQPGMKQLPEKKAPIQNEADKGGPNKRGTIAMARTGDPHSATDQFFINVEDNSGLNHQDKTVQGYGYCVFGKVVDGMNVVDKIRMVVTGKRDGHGDVPVQDVLIKSVRRAE